MHNHRDVINEVHYFLLEMWQSTTISNTQKYRMLQFFFYCHQRTHTRYRCLFFKIYLVVFLKGTHYSRCSVSILIILAHAPHTLQPSTFPIITNINCVIMKTLNTVWLVDPFLQTAVWSGLNDVKRFFSHLHYRPYEYQMYTRRATWLCRLHTHKPTHIRTRVSEPIHIRTAGTTRTPHTCIS